MAPPPSHRRLHCPSAASGAGAGELSRPRKRWQSLVLQVRGSRKPMERLLGFRGIMGDEFMPMFRKVLWSMVQKVVSEEVEKAMFRQFSAPAAPPRLLMGCTQRPRYQLVFLNGLKPVYTMMKLESEDGTAIKVALVEMLENNQTNIVRFGHLSSAKVEVVALHGNFNARNEESWIPEEFEKHIVSGREKSAQLLTGNLTLKLSGGEAFLENVTFTDNSSFTCTKKFRLGLRLVNPAGERVLEGVTDPFRVKERRVEGFEKHYPPKLGDEVWRLKKIGKNGAYHQALSNNGIDSVQKFLQAYMKDEERLKQIFSKMHQSTWKSIIGHAMTCELGNGLHLYKVRDQDVGLFFDAIYQLVGVKLGDCYKPIDLLDPVEKNSVEILKKEAYQSMNALPYNYNYKMVDNSPVPLDRFPAEVTMSIDVLPNQQTLNYGQQNSYLGDTSTSQAFESRQSRETFSTSQGFSNVPVDISRFVRDHISNDAQLRHEPIINRNLPYNSSQGALLSGPGITQLQIPNNEISYFGPNASPPIANNILISQVSTQIDQHRQSVRSHLSEESYSCRSLDRLSSTDAVISLMQSQLQPPRNSESFSNHSNQQYNTQTTIQSQQVFAGFQPLRTNSFDSTSCDELIQNFISQSFNSEGASTPLSPRKWVKIRAALKLASVGRLSRASRRGSHCTPSWPRLVPTI